MRQINLSSNFIRKVIKYFVCKGQKEQCTNSREYQFQYFLNKYFKNKLQDLHSVFVVVTLISRP